MNGMYSLTSLLMLYSLFSRSVATLGNQPSHVTPEDGPVKDYTGYSILKITPKSEKSVQFLHNLNTVKLNVDITIRPTEPLSPVEVIVPPTELNSFRNLLLINGLVVKVKVPNVQKLIDEENDSHGSMSADHADHEAYQSPVGAVGLSTNKYHSYDAIKNWMYNLTTLGSKKTNYVKLHKVGHTLENRELLVMQIGEAGPGKVGVFIDAGMKPREWISISLAIYQIGQLARKNNAATKMLKDNVYFIMPMANPDGYHFSIANDRLWNKNRRFLRDDCYGIDLSTNFDNHFKLYSTPDQDVPCSPLYSGSSSNSEYETQAIQRFLRNMKADHHVKLDMYISYQAYGQLWMLPYAYQNSMAPGYSHMHTIAKKAAYILFPGKYHVGQYSKLNGLTAGCSADYALEKTRARLSYTIRLPGHGSGYLVPAWYINTIVDSGWMSLQSVIEHK